MIWSEMETLDRSEIEKIQLERLQETVKRVYEKVPPYRKKMEEAGVKPEDIKTLKDLAKLPFTTKADLRDNYPFGLFAVPKKDLVRVHASSGTTGVSGSTISGTASMMAFTRRPEISAWGMEAMMLITEITDVMIREK